MMTVNEVSKLQDYITEHLYSFERRIKKDGSKTELYDSAGSSKRAGKNRNGTSAGRCIPS